MNDYPNIIFVVIDTLRKDYAQPIEEEFKKVGFMPYENAIAPSPWTTPSHASIFTGLYPAFHGAHETKNKKDIEIKLSKKHLLLSSQLKEMGYSTYLLSANPYIRPEFGLIGFDYFYGSLYAPRFFLSNKDNIYIKKLRQKNKINGRIDLAKLLIHNKKYILLAKLILNSTLYNAYVHFYGKIKNWPMDKGVTNIINVSKKILKDTKSTPKFIFINLMEVHEPYSIDDTRGEPIFIKNLKTNKIDKKASERWKKFYPSEVSYVIKKLMELIKSLKYINIFDNSLIIITSDHGQLLGEYGRIGHGTFLYDELLRIPLLIKYPKNMEIETTQQNAKYVSLIDLKAFIIELIENRLKNDSTLYKDTVFAESYGIHVNIDKPASKEEEKNIAKLEKYRIAIYYKNVKGIFNVNEWKIEEIFSPRIQIEEDIGKEMKNKVVKFLKNATTARFKKISLR